MHLNATTNLLNSKPGRPRSLIDALFSMKPSLDDVRQLMTHVSLMTYGQLKSQKKPLLSIFLGEVVAYQLKESSNYDVIIFL